MMWALAAPFAPTGRPPRPGARPSVGRREDPVGRLVAALGAGAVDVGLGYPAAARLAAAVHDDAHVVTTGVDPAEQLEQALPRRTGDDQLSDGGLLRGASPPSGALVQPAAPPLPARGTGGRASGHLEAMPVAARHATAGPVAPCVA